MNINIKTKSTGPNPSFSFRLSLILAIVIFLVLGYLAYWMLDETTFMTHRLIQQDTKNQLQAVQTHFIKSINLLEQHINAKTYPSSDNVIGLIAIESLDSNNVKFWPSDDGDETKDIWQASDWFRMGVSNPPESADKKQQCFAKLQEIQNSSQSHIKRKLRWDFFASCDRPMFVDNHYLQAEELVLFLEEHRQFSAKWLEFWKNTINMITPINAQKQYLRQRLETLKADRPRALTAAHYLKQAIRILDQAKRPHHVDIINIMRNIIQLESSQKLGFLQERSRFSQYGSAAEVLFLTGSDIEKRKWVALLKPINLLAKVVPKDFSKTHFRLLDKAPVENTNVLGAYVQPLKDVSLYIQARPLPGDQALLTITLQVIIVVLFSLAIALLLVIVITDYRRVHAMLRVNNLRTEFIGRISHQFRTPLTTIRLYAETMQQRELSAQKKEIYLNTLIQETEQLSNLTTRLLNSSRIQQGKYAFDFYEFDIGALCEQITLRIKKQMRFPIQEMRIHTPPDLPSIMGDQESLGELLYNLLENAAKYSEGGVIHLNVEYDMQKVQIIVDDNGPGIPLRYRQKVFNSYYRINDKLTQRVSGTGLGLSLVKNITNAHQGRISIHDSPLGGTRFIVELPYNKSGEDHA